MKCELLFMRMNKKGVIEAIAYNVDINLNSRLDMKYINKFITKHLQFYKKACIRKVILS